MVEEKVKIKKKIKKTDDVKNTNKMDVEESDKDKITTENNDSDMKVEEIQTVFERMDCNCELIL
jgi:hypothetical protein